MTDRPPLPPAPQRRRRFSNRWKKFQKFFQSLEKVCLEHFQKKEDRPSGGPGFVRAAPKGLDRNETGTCPALGRDKARPSQDVAMSEGKNPSPRLRREWPSKISHSPPPSKSLGGPCSVRAASKELDRNETGTRPARNREKAHLPPSSGIISETAPFFPIVGKSSKSFSNHWKNRSAAFTLVEVLLAVVILGISLSALLAAASQAMGVIRKARNFEVARRLLAQVEAESPLRLKDAIEEGSESGTFRGGPAGWTWTRTIAAVPSPVADDDEFSDGLFLVTTTVSWSDSGRNSSEETVRYLYVPQNANGEYTLKPDT